MAIDDEGGPRAAFSMARAALTTPVDFEAVALSEADALADLRVVAMRASLERVGRFDPVRARDRFLCTFDAALTRHIVVGGVRIGFVVLRRVPGGLLLDHLYIDPRHQGRGFGASVLAKLFLEADSQGLDIRVGALKGSDANRFYVRSGFEFVEQGDWDVVYVRRHRKIA